MILNILKWLGVLPAAGGFVANFFDVEFMKELDLLHGFYGSLPHLAGIGLFFIVRAAATRHSSSLAAARATRDRMIMGAAAAVLLVMLAVWTMAPLPEDLSPPLVLWRWRLAALLYILFYIALGGSEPEL